MRPSTILLVVATIALTFSGADASLEEICRAACDQDARVNYDFCVQELANHRWDLHADAWDLAMQAADCGVGNADRAIEEIQGLLVKQETDAKTRYALMQCDELYRSMKISFAYAHDWINERNYAEGKEEAEEAISQAHKCDDVFAKAAITTPLTQHSLYSVQIAKVFTAITNLIK
ncbi:pectinesterase inhibitor 8-like [Lolium rigidum]|uniref:pectinesterase inhibitor 8-like n=1 Tax=Lolium rigidum TaxID=89674 RepID=UPI001F5D06F4|nr:pectinesterase inhibitor 8-like [Lolium rigidum]